MDNNFTIYAPKHALYITFFANISTMSKKIYRNFKPEKKLIGN